MWPLIGAVASAYGAYRANRQNKASARQAMAIEQQNAKQQMRFQERMSNTAHQRQMRDLRKSGINPMLAAKLGGASSPAGAMGKGYTYRAENIGASGVEGYSKVSSAKQAQAQTGQINEQTKKIVEEVKILKERHAERWQRLFAGMSSENVVASVQAVLNNVDVKKVLMQQDMTVTERYNLRLFLKGVREQSSHIRREASGIYATIDDAIKGVGWFAPDKGNYVMKNPGTAKQWRYKSDKN